MLCVFPLWVSSWQKVDRDLNRYEPKNTSVQYKIKAFIIQETPHYDSPSQAKDFQRPPRPPSRT
jgi:hypothetical protein